MGPAQGGGGLFPSASEGTLEWRDWKAHQARRRTELENSMTLAEWSQGSMPELPPDVGQRSTSPNGNSQVRYAKTSHGMRPHTSTLGQLSGPGMGKYSFSGKAYSRTKAAGNRPISSERPRPHTTLPHARGALRGEITPFPLPEGMTSCADGDADAAASFVGWLPEPGVGQGSSPPWEREAHGRRRPPRTSGGSRRAKTPAVKTFEGPPGHGMDPQRKSPPFLTGAHRPGTASAEDLGLARRSGHFAMEAGAPPATPQRYDPPVPRDGVVDAAQNVSRDGIGRRARVSKHLTGGTLPVLLPGYDGLELEEEEMEQAAQSFGAGDYATWFHSWFETLMAEGASFRSVALFCEMRLNELMKSHAQFELGSPNHFHIAACCELFDRVSQVLPHGELIQQLKEELYTAVYAAPGEEEHPLSSGEEGVGGESRFAMREPYFLLCKRLAIESRELRSQVQQLKALVESKDSRRMEGLNHTMKMWQRSQMRTAFRQLKHNTLDLKAQRDKMTTMMAKVNGANRLKDVFGRWRGYVDDIRAEQRREALVSMEQQMVSKSTSIEGLQEIVNKLRAKLDAANEKIEEQEAQIYELRSASMELKTVHVREEQQKGDMTQVNIQLRMEAETTTAWREMALEMSTRSVLEAPGLPAAATSFFREALRLAEPPAPPEEAAPPSAAATPDSAGSGGDKRSMFINRRKSMSRGRSMRNLLPSPEEEEINASLKSGGSVGKGRFRLPPNKECSSEMLLRPGEELVELLRLPCEKSLLRWVNHHVRFSKDSIGRQMYIRNYGSDLTDGKVYVALLQEIAREHTTPEMAAELDPDERVRLVAEVVKKLGLGHLCDPLMIRNAESGKNFLLLYHLFARVPCLKHRAPGGAPPPEGAAAGGAEEDGTAAGARLFRMTCDLVERLSVTRPVPQMPSILLYRLDAAHHLLVAIAEYVVAPRGALEGGSEEEEEEEKLAAHARMATGALGAVARHMSVVSGELEALHDAGCAAVPGEDGKDLPMEALLPEKVEGELLVLAALCREAAEAAMTAFDLRRQGESDSRRVKAQHRPGAVVNSLSLLWHRLGSTARATVLSCQEQLLHPPAGEAEELQQRRQIHCTHVLRALVHWLGILHRLSQHAAAAAEGREVGMGDVVVRHLEESVEWLKEVSQELEDEESGSTLMHAGVSAKTIGAIVRINMRWSDAVDDYKGVISMEAEETEGASLREGLQDLAGTLAGVVAHDGMQELLHPGALRAILRSFRSRAEDLKAESAHASGSSAGAMEGVHAFRALQAALAERATDVMMGSAPVVYVDHPEGAPPVGEGGEPAMEAVQEVA